MILILKRENQICGSNYHVGDPSLVGLECEHGMVDDQSCFPSDTFPKHIEEECEGNLMFASKTDPSTCHSLCKPDPKKANNTGKRSLITRKNWTKFIRLVQYRYLKFQIILFSALIQNQALEIMKIIFTERKKC